MIAPNDVEVLDQLDREALMVSLTNQPCSEETGKRIELLRGFAKEYGGALIRLVPRTPNRTLAMRKLEESVMWAVKALVIAEMEELDRG